MSSGLADHIETLYKSYREQRSTLETKWEKNHSAFRRIDNGKWKKSEKKESWQSDSYVGITRQKIIAAYSIIIDIILSNGNIPFTVKPAEIDDLSLNLLPTEYHANVDRNIDIMTALIERQFDDCHADRNLMKNTLSAGIYGVTYAKRGIVSVKKHGYRPLQETISPSGEHVQWESFSETKPSPSWIYLPVWNVFHDRETDDLQSGSGVIHRDYQSPHQIRQNKNAEFFIAENIESAVRDHSGYTSSSDTASQQPAIRDLPNRKNTIEVLEFWGRAPRRVVETFEESLTRDAFDGLSPMEGEDDGDEIEIMAMVAGGKVIRFARREGMERPFYMARWEDDLDSNQGVGIADNLESAQLLLNGAIRAFEDNKKLSGNVILALKRQEVANAPKEVKPGLTIDLVESCENAAQAVQAITIPDVGETLLSVIRLALDLADSDSNIPRVQQGQSGGSKETAFELSQRLEKSGKYLGAVVRNIDEGLIEPITAEFLRYNMEDPELREGKGNFRIIADGFTSFQSRVTRVAAIRQFLELVLSNPAMQKELKFGELAREFAQLLDLEPDQILMSEEDNARIAEQEAAAAELENRKNDLVFAGMEADIKLKNAEAETKLAKLKIEAEKLKLDQLAAVQKATGDVPGRDIVEGVA